MTGNLMADDATPARVLGRTGLTVSRLGLGMAALGRPGYITLGHADDLPGNHHSGDAGESKPAGG